MILPLRNVILCLLYPKCWRLLGTNVLLIYSSSGIYICFLLLHVALTVKRSSPTGKMPVLLGKDKTFCSYRSWTLCIWVTAAAPAGDACRNREEIALQTGALSHWTVSVFNSFHEHNRGAPASPRRCWESVHNTWGPLLGIDPLGTNWSPHIHIAGTSTGRPGSITFMFLETESGHCTVPQSDQVMLGRLQTLGSRTYLQWP